MVDQGNDANTLQKVMPQAGWTPSYWQVSQMATLSFKALGIHTYLMSLPEGWEFSATRIAQGRPEGRDAVEAGLRELREAGLYKAERIRGSNGRFKTVTTVSALPVDNLDVKPQVTPKTAYQGSVHQGSVNQGSKNRDLKEIFIPPPTSSTNAAVDNPVEAQIGEEEALKLKNNYPDDLKVFVKNLSYGGVKPSQADYKRVAQALKRLWGKVPESELKKQLELNTDSARCLPAVYEARLNSWTVDDFKPKAKSAPTEKPHTMSPSKFESAPGVPMPNDVKAALEKLLGPRKHWGSKRSETSTTGPQKVAETLGVLPVPATV